MWGSWPDINYSLTVTVLSLWGVHSDERTCVSFVYAAGPRQCRVSWVRVPLDSWPYFTVSDLRLPFSSPPTTHRVTVEIFDPASTRTNKPLINFRRRPHGKHVSRVLTNVFTTPLPSDRSPIDPRISVHFTQKCAIYKKSVSAGTCLLNRCLAMDLYIIIYI
jgi:hypothetical protein